MTTRRRYRVALLTLLVLVGGIWGTIAATGIEPRLGLDLQGGISVVLTADEGGDSDAIDKAVDIIRNRVDALGVAEPDISRQGNNVLVQLPGVDDPQKARDIIGRTAQLRFRPALEILTPGTEPYTAATPPDCTDATTFPEDDPTKETVLCARTYDPTTDVELPRDQWEKLRLGPAALSGEDVASARAEPPSGTGGPLTWNVSMNFTSEGARKFEDITGKLACNQGPTRQMAIVLDQIVETHPQMAEDLQCNQGIPNGTASITGDFSQQDAQELALVLRYGALPVAFEASTFTTVSPTLGRDSLNGGLIAALIGLGIVFAYVALFYRFLGLLIWLGILLHAAFTFGVVIILGETAGFALTLAGIAGLIVSLGIAADSFIVYFERLKDEVAGGKSVRASVDRAWQSAWRTIVAADLVTALAAFVLYFLAVGSVRGFALMLGLSTALDLFISYLYMHPAVWLLAQTKTFNRSRTLGNARVGAEAPVPAGGAR